MSVPLNFKSACEECGRIMKPGTLVDFFKVGNETRYSHAEGGCEAAAPAPMIRPKKRRTEDNFDIRYCTGKCPWSNGVAFRRGEAPAGCPLCGAQLIDEAQGLAA